MKMERANRSLRNTMAEVGHQHDPEISFRRCQRQDKSERVDQERSQRNTLVFRRESDKSGVSAEICLVSAGAAGTL